MTVRIRHITVDCAKCYDLSLFWSALTGFRENPDDPNLPEHTEAAIEAPDGSAAMLFIQVPEGKAGKNRIHLDLQPTDATRDEEVQRILGAGRHHRRGLPQGGRHRLGHPGRPRGQRVLRGAQRRRARRVLSPSLRRFLRAAQGRAGGVGHSQG